MSTFGTLLQVRELPWEGLVKDLRDSSIKSSEDIIRSANLDWEVASIKMKTDIHDRVLNYHAIYRTDTKEVLGAVNMYKPDVVQNADMFSTIEHMIGHGLKVETAADFNGGRTVFGCFKLDEKYKILDDDVDHYFVVVNDHMRPDGKVTILNTPIRIICQNTLTAALNNSIYKLRMPVCIDAEITANLCEKLITSVGTSITTLTDISENLFKEKITSSYVDKVMDVLFPYHLVDGYPDDCKSNETISMKRDTFISDCMGADDLDNYRGTKLQLLHACIDWDEHFYRNADKAYDLEYRMSRMPAFNNGTDPLKVIQFLKIKDKIAA